MKKKKIKLEARLDLHGLKIQDAYEETCRFICACQADGLRRIEIITGKSGKISHEAPFWIENLGLRSEKSLHGGSIIVFI